MSQRSVEACKSVSRTPYAGDVIYKEIMDAAGADYSWKAAGTGLNGAIMVGHASWIDAYYPEGETFVQMGGGDEAEDQSPQLP